MRSIASLVERVSLSRTTILLLGETGSGKELVADMIHARSSRRAGPLIKVNCAGLSTAFGDVELFGSEEESSGGGIRIRKGLLEQADGGTLFLDEVGEMPRKAQAWLQRFLQRRELRRVGGAACIQLDLRVIAATRHDLRALVQRGAFREDLWFRLAVCPIALPPLRERREDIIPLAEALIARKSRELGIPTVPALSSKMRSGLMTYDWPGNVTELENCIERSLLLTQGVKFSFLLENGADMACTAEEESPSGANNGQEGFAPLDDIIAAYIKNVLEHTGWRVSGPKGAARILGLNPNTLHSKMRKLNISLPKAKNRSFLS